MEILSPGDAEGQIARNGGAPERWRPSKGTVSAICIEVAPVQESPWKLKRNGENRKETCLGQSPQRLLAANDQLLLLFNAGTDVSMSAAPSCNGTNRDLNKTIEAEHRWQLAMKANMGFGSEGPSIYGSSDHHFDQDYVEQHPVNVFTHLNNPTDFIDAWSVDNLNGSNNGNAKSSLSMNHENLSPSLNLSIAMVAGNVLN